MSNALHQEIDRLITPVGKEGEFAPLCSDEEFLRRVTLDLTGKIPTVQEAREFLASRDPDKRRKRIDALLQSPEYARHFSQVFDVLLMDRRADVRVKRAEWEGFLLTSFSENKPYDQFVREMLLADGSDPKSRPAAKFYLDREMEPNLVTRDLSRLFLGRNIQCAQCHDHPHIADYKQAHFYGIQAFLNRSYLFPAANNPLAVIAEKAEGEVSFSDVFDKKKLVMMTGPKLLEGKQVTEPKFDKGKEYKIAPAKDVKPIPEFSRRTQLAGILTDPETKAFSRTAANRIWWLMFGRGLVNPVDQDHSDNPPSHPELLDRLTQELASHKFDLKYLLREIALSKTYQRSSEQPKTETDPARYQVAALKPLSPEQFAGSILEATGFSEFQRQTLGKNLTEPKLFAQQAGPFNAIVRKFAGTAGEPAAEELQASLEQTLFLKNSPTLRDLLAVRKGSLMDRLAAVKETPALADELFLSVLTRKPTTDEIADLDRLLKSTSDRNAALVEITWALLASAEFRFNH
jgi:hypothetical protein